MPEFVSVHILYWIIERAYGGLCNDHLFIIIHLSLLRNRKGNLILYWTISMKVETFVEILKQTYNWNYRIEFHGFFFTFFQERKWLQFCLITWMKDFYWIKYLSVCLRWKGECQINKIGIIYGTFLYLVFFFY